MPIKVMQAEESPSLADENSLKSCPIKVETSQETDENIIKNGNGVHELEPELSDRRSNENQSRTSSANGAEPEPTVIIQNNDHQFEPQPISFDLGQDPMHPSVSANNFWPAQHQEEHMFQNYQAMNPQPSIPSYSLNNNNSFPPQMPFGSIGQPSYMPPTNHGQFSSPPGMHSMSMMGGMGPMNGPMGNYGYQNTHSQNQRRAITAQHNYGSVNGKPMNPRYPWGNQNSWQNGNPQGNMSPWTMALQQQKAMNRGPPVNMGPGLKNNQPMGNRNQASNFNSLMVQQKFNKRSSPNTMMGAMKPVSYDSGMPGSDMNSVDSATSYQNTQGNGDSMKMDSLQTQILDIMRQSGPYDQDQSKGFSGNGGIEYAGVGDEGIVGGADPQHGGGIPGMNNSFPYSAYRPDRQEKFSRKVFVGGLPPDIDEDEISASFRKFGPVVVDWPHKAESKSYFPPKGYCFLLFQEEISVQALIDACLADDNKFYWCVTSPTMKDKPVQIRPWNLSDSDFVMDGSQPLDPRKTIFVGGVPRPLRAVELAMIIDRLYGGVCYAGIDTDPELKYPKGAGRVAFSNQQSYIAAISARFVQLQHADIDKRVEVKPYVLDDQFCDECQGARCNQKFAPFFCANITCLQYYCEQCWATIHSRTGREYHKPLVKEGADRPRAVPFRWC